MRSCETRVSFVRAVVKPIEGKPVILVDNTILPTVADRLEKTYYVAGFLISTMARAIMVSYTYELRQEMRVVDTIKVPKYDEKDEVHKKIVELSRKVCELARCVYSESKPDYCRDIDAERELRRVVELAVEYRQRIRDWLHKVDPGEFPKGRLVATVRD